MCQGTLLYPQGRDMCGFLFKNLAFGLGLSVNVIVQMPGINCRCHSGFGPHRSISASGFGPGVQIR